MKQTDKKKITTLSEWLEIATRWLAAPGNERVTREIEAHYAEAVRARVAQGETITTAEAGAIGDLGDPKVAARRFKRNHFTSLEAKYISNLSGQKTALIFGCLPPAIVLTFAYSAISSNLILRFFAALFAMTIFPAILMIVLQRPASKARTLLLLWLGWVNGLGTAFVFLLMLILSPDRANQHFCMIVLAMFMLGHVIPSFLAWNRVRKMSDEIDENTGIVG